MTNSKNTVQGFKKFHGRPFADPYVQAAKSNLVYDLAQMPSGSTGIKVGFLQFLHFIDLFIYFLKEHTGNFVIRLIFLKRLKLKFLWTPGVFRWCIWRRRRCSAWSRSLGCCWPNWRRRRKVHWRNLLLTASSRWASLLASTVTLWSQPSCLKEFSKTSGWQEFSLEFSAPGCHSK